MDLLGTIGFVSSFASPVGAAKPCHIGLRTCPKFMRKSLLSRSSSSYACQRHGIFAMSDGSEESGLSEEIWKSAFDSGAEVRDRLRKMAEEREALRIETEDSLNKLSARLTELVDAVRKEAGMPPVASPPVASPAVANPAVASPAVTPSASKSPSRTSSESSTGKAMGQTETYEDSSSSDEPYMDPSNFGFDSAAGWQVLASENQLPTIDDSGVKFRVECDKDGCSIIELQGNAPAGPGVRSQFLQSGPGFRVGYDPDGPGNFCGTIGNEHWLLALSRDEIRHFKRLCLALQKKMDRISRGLDNAPEQKSAVRRSGDGMFNERVGRTGSDCSVELESKLLWVQAFGKPDPGHYAIRAIFMEGRQSESYWAANFVPGLLAAVSKLLVD